MKDLEYDPIAYAYVCANHFQVLGVAIAWDQAAQTLTEAHPAAARIAFERAISGYRGYGDAWKKHLPASRFDDDYGRDLVLATQRRNALLPGGASDDLPAWLIAVLDRRYAEAAAILVEKPAAPHELAVVAVLAQLCAIAGQGDTAARLLAWTT